MKISASSLFSCFLFANALGGTPLAIDLKTLGKMTRNADSAGISFVTTGDVAYVCNADNSRIDLVSRDRLHQLWLSPNVGPSVNSGDRLLIYGHIDKPTAEIRKETFQPCVSYADSLVLLGKASPRRHEEISGGRLACGDFATRSVSIRGVLAGARRDELNANWNWFALRTPTGKIFVATPNREHAIPFLKSLTDALVLVTGIANQTQRTPSFGGHYLIPVGPESVKCLEPAPSDVSLCPQLPDTCQTEVGISYPKIPNLLHRHRIRGKVLGQSKSRLFVLTDQGCFCSLIPESSNCHPSPGDTVTAVGFPEISTCGLDLTEAVIHTVAFETDALPCGEMIEARSLFSTDEGMGAFNRKRHGAVISLSGLVANSRENILYEGIVHLSCGVYTVPVDVTLIRDSLAEMPDTGYWLSVTGVCFGSFTSGQTTSDLPVFTGFTVYPRVPEDVTILTRPSWWTAGRLLGIILALLVVIIAILIWNRSLAVLSAQRGKRLYLEAIAHTKAELKVEERTHLAVELHDALSQTLTGVALQIDSACLANKNGNPRVGQVLEVAKTMLSSCRKELHNCLWDLRSRTFEEKDMTEAIVRTLAPYADDVEISVRFNVPRSIFEETQSHAILRMVRELVVNAITHGHATRLWIAGEHHDGLVSFSVRDNGCGFDPSAAPGPRQGHFGLQGVKERLDKLDGNLDIQSEAGKGAKISIRLRIQGEEHG